MPIVAPDAVTLFLGQHIAPDSGYYSLFFPDQLQWKPVKINTAVPGESVGGKRSSPYPCTKT